MSNNATLAHKWAIDLDQSFQAGGTPSFVPIAGVQDFKPDVNSTLQDSTTYDNPGWEDQTKTAEAWVHTIKLLRVLVAAGDPTVYDPGQEILRATQGQFGKAATVSCRWYDRNGGPEARAGIATVAWSNDGGDNKALENVSVTLTGKGAFTNLTPNPITLLTTSVPVVSSVSPATAAHTGGALVKIVGSGFLAQAVTAVKFGTTSATVFTVESDSVIWAVVPAVTAGAQNVTVVNGTGPSTPAVAFTAS